MQNRPGPQDYVTLVQTRSENPYAKTPLTAEPSCKDEARIGQKNGLVRQWARRGSRPRQPADQRYESAYLFGAICPARGTGAALAMPYADSEAMQLHLVEISSRVRRGAHAVLLLDRAGWHTTGRLVVPKNITLVFLPSRAPSSIRSRTSGSTCARTGSRTACSKPTKRSSKRPVTLGVASSPSPPPSPQSATAAGRTSVRNKGRWYYHERTIGKILKQLGFSHVSARPRHPAKDEETVAAFKKTSPRR